MDGLMLRVVHDQCQHFVAQNRSVIIIITASKGLREGQERERTLGGGAEDCSAAVHAT